MIIYKNKPRNKQEKEPLRNAKKAWAHKSRRSNTRIEIAITEMARSYSLFVLLLHQTLKGRTWGTVVYLQVSIAPTLDASIWLSCQKGTLKSIPQCVFVESPGILSQ